MLDPLVPHRRIVPVNREVDQLALRVSSLQKIARRAPALREASGRLWFRRIVGDLKRFDRRPKRRDLLVLLFKEGSQASDLETLALVQMSADTADPVAGQDGLSLVEDRFDIVVEVGIEQPHHNGLCDLGRDARPPRAR